MSNDNDTDLERLAQRLSNNERFFAFSLAAFQRKHGMDDAELTARLGCSATTLLDLKLCRRPGMADTKTLDEDLDRLAGAFKVALDMLRQIAAAAPL